MKNTFIDELRRQQKEHLFGFDEEEIRPAAGSGDSGVSRPPLALMRMDIDGALAQLTPLYRMTVMAVDIEGFRLEEVAAIFDVPLGTVKSRLSRARALMASYLDGYVSERERRTHE